MSGEGGAAARRALRCLVAGRVQGVYYRASAARRAAELELDGWARNRADGRVEVVVAGAPDKLEAFAGWLWQGPPAARVESVQLEEWPEAVEPGFAVRR